MKRLFLSLLFFVLFYDFILSASDTIHTKPDVNPLDLSFQRLAVRRFIFSNNLILNEFVPSEIVAFESMHPAFTVSDSHVPKVAESFVSHIDDGKLILDSEAGNQSISIYMGGVNPYATYEIDVDSYNLGVVPTEIGIELARMGLRDKVQVVSKLSAQGNEIFFRLYEGNKLKREIKYGNTLPAVAASGGE